MNTHCFIGTIPIEWARWRRPQIAETFASVRVSAPCYRFAEYVGFLTVVKSELKFRQIQRQIFLADVVVGADDSSLKQRPEGINVLGVYLTAHILAATMGYDFMRHCPFEQPIAGMLVCGDQFNAVA